MKWVWGCQGWWLSWGIPRCLFLITEGASEVWLCWVIQIFSKMLDQSSPNHSKHLEINVETNSSRMSSWGNNCIKPIYFCSTARQRRNIESLASRLWEVFWPCHPWSKESMACEDLWQYVCKNLYTEVIRSFPIKIKWYIELPCTAHCSLMIHPQGVSKLTGSKLDALDEKSWIQNYLDNLGKLSWRGEVHGTSRRQAESTA